MDSKYIQQISKTTGFSLAQINNIHRLHTEGSTIPFIARYRKEATGNLDEVQINTVIEQINYFGELVKRKETIIKTIEGLGKLNEELRTRIENSFDAIELEDIYLPYKPKRRTKAMVAIEKGLEPLAKVIYAQTTQNPEQEAINYLTEDVKEVNDALQGARDIIAEWIAEDEQARNKVRYLFESGATLYARVVKTKKEAEEAQKYLDYFDFNELLSKCPSHRLLAIRRGEKEGILLMDINIDKEKAIEGLCQIFIRASNTSAAEVRKAIEDGYDRLLKPSIENEFRLISKNRADEEAIKVFAENLRQLLLSPPLGSLRVLALDPGYRTGCKLVCLDEHGSLLHNSTIFPHQSQHQREEAVNQVKSLVEKYNIEAVGIGNGTAGRETEQFVRSIDVGKPIRIFQVNESGASIYSASEVAREEFPDHDVTVRGAISIGRRLLDPLSELVKIDPKSIGVGQYQHDVNQARLKESLDKVVESCVNHVGVDLNTASKHLLMYVSGLSSSLAKNIVEYRAKNGGFTSRTELRKVALMGPKSFEQCAGFLRIPGARNVLDNSGVHPESYHIVQAMAADMQSTPEQLVQKPELRKSIDKKKYISETAGTYTIEDILKELEKPGRDPREAIEEFRFDENIKVIEDLKPGMTVPGIVTNITKFGAFVDIGVKQDGLVHISQLSDTFISDPNDIVKLQQKLMVTVVEVDVTRKRIALTLKDKANKKENAKPAAKQAAQEKNQPGSKSTAKTTVAPQKSIDSFQSKLMELRKKFT